MFTYVAMYVKANAQLCMGPFQYSVVNLKLFSLQSTAHVDLPDIVAKIFHLIKLCLTR